MRRVLRQHIRIILFATEHGTRTYSYIRRFLNCKISNNFRLDWNIFLKLNYTLLKFRTSPFGLQPDDILSFTEGKNTK